MMSVSCWRPLFLVFFPQKPVGYGDHPVPVTVQRATTVWTALSTSCYVCGSWCSRRTVGRLGLVFFWYVTWSRVCGAASQRICWTARLTTDFDAFVCISVSMVVLFSSSFDHLTVITAPI